MQTALAGVFAAGEFVEYPGKKARDLLNPVPLPCHLRVT
jgi:thioredoxin reductase